MSEAVDQEASFFSTNLETDRPIGNQLKRVIDFVLALFVILLLSPLLTFCYLAVLSTTRRDPIFRHRRVGFGGRCFDCYKFRTMEEWSQDEFLAHLDKNPSAIGEWLTTHKLTNDPRVTPLGSVLRKSSLDELPQLFTVLKGDMSLVGPRPITARELGRYSGKALTYLSCRPGITGLWQISGRSSTSFRRRVTCDVFYARNWSLWFDLEILIKTPLAVMETNNAR
jgi:exopolysaccharide production protein ExoY